MISQLIILLRISFIYFFDCTHLQFFNILFIYSALFGCQWKNSIGCGTEGGKRDKRPSLLCKYQLGASWTKTCCTPLCTRVKIPRPEWYSQVSKLWFDVDRHWKVQLVDRPPWTRRPGLLCCMVRHILSLFICVCVRVCLFVNERVCVCVCVCDTDFSS